MRKALLAALLAACCLAAGAQEAGDLFARPLDDKGRAGLAAVCAKIAAQGVVRGGFDQAKTVARLKKDFRSSGSFLFSGRDGVVWNVEKPYPSLIVMTPTRLAQKAPGGKLSVMEGSGNAVFQRFADTLQAVFAGRFDSLERDFELHFAGDAADWRIGLVPREATVKSVVRSMEIRGDRFIRSLRLVEAGGDSSLYSFRGSSAGGALTEAERQLFALRE